MDGKPRHQPTWMFIDAGRVDLGKTTAETPENKEHRPEKVYYKEHSTVYNPETPGGKPPRDTG